MGLKVYILVSEGTLPLIWQQAMDLFQVFPVIPIRVEIPGSWDFRIALPFRNVGRRGMAGLYVPLNDLQLFLQCRTLERDLCLGSIDRGCRASYLVVCLGDGALVLHLDPVKS